MEIKLEEKRNDYCEWCSCPGNLFYDEGFSMWLCHDCCQEIDDADEVVLYKDWE